MRRRAHTEKPQAPAAPVQSVTKETAATVSNDAKPGRTPIDPPTTADPAPIPTFSFTVQASAPEGRGSIGEGSLYVELGHDLRPASLNDKGEAQFKNIPIAFSGRAVRFLSDVPGRAPKWYEARISGNTIKLRPDPAEIHPPPDSSSAPHPAPTSPPPARRFLLASRAQRRSGCRSACHSRRKCG